MFTHKPTNTIFENRKNAVRVMGKYRYMKALEKCEFDFNYPKQESK